MIGKILFFAAGVYIGQTYKLPNFKEAIKKGEKKINTSAEAGANYQKFQSFVKQAREIAPTLIK